MRRQLLRTDIPLKEIFALDILCPVSLAVALKMIADRCNKNADRHEALLTVDDRKPPFIYIAGRH